MCGKVAIATTDLVLARLWAAFRRLVAVLDRGDLAGGDALRQRDDNGRPVRWVGSDVDVGPSA